MKKILIISSNYKTDLGSKNVTGVVNDFAEELVGKKNDVTVINISSYNPIYYFLPHFIKEYVVKKLNYTPPPKKDNKDMILIIDHVQVYKFSLYKLIPHQKPFKFQLNRIINSCNKEVTESEYIVCHWSNPGIYMAKLIRRSFPLKRIFLVVHDDYYYKNIRTHIVHFDKILFRNKALQGKFLSKYNSGINTGIVESGISNTFFDTPLRLSDQLNNSPPFTYIFVGQLIERKFPLETISTVTGDFTVKSYIVCGNGPLEGKIKSISQRNPKVKLRGFLGKEDLIQEYDKSDILVMISKSEAFGLTYLEAMSRGLIVIGSKNEGVDGIVIDSYNGFLCDAGDMSNLVMILKRIHRLSPTEILELRLKAIETAQRYTKDNMADKYLEHIST